MRKVLKIDSAGLFLADVILQDGSPTPPDCVETYCHTGFYRPKWDGVQWVEGLTQVQINMIKASEPTLTPTVRDLNINKYGAKGDNAFRSIASVFPSVTLAQVQALNPLATLNNSADWYALQTAINAEKSLFIPTGKYVIDLPLEFNTSGVFIYGQGSANTTIKNSGKGHALVINKNCKIGEIAVEGNSGSGSGIFINNGCSISDIRCYVNGRYGIEFTATNHVVSCFIDKATLDYNKLGGLFLKAGDYAQKNNIAMKKIYAVKNGTGVDNLALDATPTNGHGIYLDGGLGVSIEDSVAEYNSGVGLYVDMTDVYTYRGLTVSNMYYEQNKYAQLLMDTRRGVWRHIKISGSTYNAPFPLPANSLKHTIGHVVVYGEWKNIIDFEVDGVRGLGATWE